jgi:hypothetical protein
MIETPWGLIPAFIVLFVIFKIGQAAWNGIQNSRNTAPPHPTFSAPQPSPPKASASEPSSTSTSPLMQDEIQPCPRCGSRREPHISGDPNLGIQRRVCADCGQILPT